MTEDDRRPRPRLLYPGLALLAITWLLMLLYGSGPLDQQLYRSVYAGDHPPVEAVARAVTFMGEPTILVGAGFAVAAWLWWGRRQPRLAFALTAVILVGRGLSEVQKFAVGRPRPALEPHLVVVRTASFPSGHATSSMIFYISLALALLPAGHARRIGVACAILLSLAIGCSRVLLGVHWPSDVIGGWCFGLLWVLLTLEPTIGLLGRDGQTLNRNSITSPS